MLIGAVVGLYPNASQRAIAIVMAVGGLRRTLSGGGRTHAPVGRGNRCG